MELSNETYQPISKVYDGKNIFVTGSSGFLGKVFVEKMLYGCPNIGKVYVLLRETETVSVKEKLKTMLECPIFKRLKEERPHHLEKIIPIVGNISKTKLGINSQDENILTEKVSMVFHFAATVKFNDPLQKVLNINYEGTRRILELCSKINNLEVFVYVSTAYSNSNREVIDEVVYTPVIPLNQVGELLKPGVTYTSQQIKQYIKDLPNTYTMSKNLAESLVAEYHEKHKFPMVILRPSIVISCKDEPLQGWVDNWYGPTSIALAIKNSIVKALNADPNNVLDLIPVDYVSNLVIVTGARCRSVDNVMVYNSCSSSVNPITLKKFTDHVEISTDLQNNNFFPYPKLMYIKMGWLMAVVTFLFETIPTYLAYYVSRIFRKKNMHLKILAKSRAVRKSLHPFTRRTWMMKSENTTALANSLSLTDSKIFKCDAADIDWDEYIPVYLRGVQKYLLDKKK